jgi:CRISPR-associated protein Cst1
LHHVTKFDELEDKGYFQIIDTLNQEKTKQANREIENIQIVKLNADNSLRPYTFNTLSRERLHVLQKNKNLLEKLIGVYVKNDEGYLNLYQEVTNRIYQNRKQFDLIYKLINLFLAEKIKFSSYIWIILLISNQSQRRGDKMNYKQIREFQQYGLNLREAYKGHENKLSGISYRLLNAAKVKNESRFMDTLLNAYMYQRKPVPLPFVEALNSDSRFQTIAYAFLLGLLGEQGLNKNNEEEDSDGK